MPQINRVLAEANGQQVWMTASQADTLNVLEGCNKGGAACIHDYVATSGYTIPQVADYQVITRFNYDRLLNRSLTALKAITVDDVDLTIIPDSKLKGKTREEWFAIAHAELIASAEKTLANDRSDARRQGHDRCYQQFANGVKVHYLTEKGTDGLMHPVLLNGHPQVESIKLSVLVLNKKVKVEGTRKHTEHGAKVLAKNAIGRVLNQRSVGIRTLSLKEGAFSTLNIDHNVIVGDNIKPLID